MASDAEKFTYLSAERGDRTRPRRRDRKYWHLRLLLDRLRRVAASEHLAGGERLLDFGCGNKPYRELFAGKFRQHIGADIAGNESAELVVTDDGRIPAPDESFEGVLSSQVLEHVAEPRVYLGEALRVLKEGGALILSTHGVWPYHPDPTDFWRWTKDGLVREISRAGFEVAEVHGVFGAESSALQLWQDSTFERLPRPLRPAYTWFFQTLIGFIERRNPDKLSDDASVYVVLARKPPRASAGATRGAGRQESAGVSADVSARGSD